MMMHLYRRLPEIKSEWKATTVTEVYRKGLCIGCGICAIACSSKAITMKRSKSMGLMVPDVDSEICTKCGACLEVCFGYEVASGRELESMSIDGDPIIGYYIHAYAGATLDQELRQKSASGGLVTNLLAYAFKESLIDGALVTSMTPGILPVPQAFIATSRTALLKSTGSKYAPVSFNGALNMIDTDRRYAVVGLPCHIYALRKLSAINRRIGTSLLLYFGLLCGGMPNLLGIEYLLDRHGFRKCYINSIRYRDGQWPGNLWIMGKCGTTKKHVSVPYPDYWQGADRYFLTTRCSLCHDGFNESSDISFGDLWLPEESRGFQKSLLIVRTEQGDNLIQSATDSSHIRLSSLDNPDILKSQQGLVDFKFLNLSGRIRTSRQLGRPLPKFEKNQLPPPSIRSYLKAIDIYLGMALASKRKLWFLLRVFIKLKRYLAAAASLTLKK
ncbi:MAG: Coenzyme F420 hydrogenase/dehydrogenase, beta subunit C-terminal domain [Candidatus Thorarchaeota archaeon]